MTLGRDVGEVEGQPCRCTPYSPLSTVDSLNLEGLPSLLQDFRVHSFLAVMWGHILKPSTKGHLCRLLAQHSVTSQFGHEGVLNQSYTHSTSPLLQV